MLVTIKRQLEPILTMLNSVNFDDSAIPNTANVFQQLQTITETEISHQMDFSPSEENFDSVPPTNHLDSANVTTRRRARSPSTVDETSDPKRQHTEPNKSNDDGGEISDAVSRRLTFADIMATAPSNTSSSTTHTTNILRSLYVTPFSPFTKPEKVMEVLKGNDNLKNVMEGVKVKSLASTRKDKKDREMTFVSFKIDIPRQNYDIFVTSDVWKEGNLTVKEFVQRNSARKLTPTTGDATTKPPKSANTHINSKNGVGKVKTQSSKQNATKKQGPKRTHQPVQHPVQQPVQQPAFVNSYPMMYCPYPQPSFFHNGYNGHYVGHQQGNQY